MSKIELLPNDLASSSSAATAQQHEPEVASTDLVKLDKASQLVLADVIRQIKIEFSGVLLGITYICKSTTIPQYDQIYFVNLPLCICILNGIIAEPYSEEATVWEQPLIKVVFD